MPNQSKITKVRSIRASNEFWDMVKNEAKIKGVDINKFVINAVKEYCKGVENVRK